MKMFYKVFVASLLVAVMFLDSCSDPQPTFDEQMQSCLSEHFEVDSVDNFEVTDTVFVSDLDSLEVIFENLSADMKKSKEGTLIRLDSARASLAKAELEIEEITFDMLIPFAEQNIEDWKNIILQEEANISYADSVLLAAEGEVEFFKQARKSILENKAYYQVVSQVKESRVNLAVSPGFEVIREF